MFRIMICDYDSIIHVFLKKLETNVYFLILQKPLVGKQWKRAATENESRNLMITSALLVKNQNQRKNYSILNKLIIVVID